MSTSLPGHPGVTPATASQPDVQPPTRTTWLREPLLHFVLLGALLFGVDHLLVTRRDDPSRIVLSAATDQGIRKLFRDSRGRDPEAVELKALRERWIDNEVLYREGLAQQVDRGDTAIRERVIFKALSVVDAGIKAPPVDDQVLRSWFEGRRAKYDEPPRYDFQEAVLPGEPTETVVRSFADALNAGTPGDAKAGLRVFKGRPLDNLVLSYGPEFARSLGESAVGEWRAHRTREGWRVMRLEALIPGKAAQFEALRGVVLQDWTDAVMADKRTEAVRAVGKKYTVVIEASTP